MSCRPSFFRLRRQKKDHPRSDGSAKDSLPTSAPAAPPSSTYPNPQLQSLLLTRLPLDIRVLVYEYVLASAERVHIIVSPANLGHVECKEVVVVEHDTIIDRDGDGQAQRSVTHNVCLGYETPERAPRGPWPVFDGGKMGLLRCCGVVYEEAIRILYAHNTFDLNSISTFTTFVSAISPASLHTIRFLSLSLFYHAWLPHSSVANLRQITCPPQFKFEWKKCCDMLAAMHALQTLHVTIGLSPQNARRVALIEGLWFEELGRVGRVRERAGRGLRVFVVKVNWEASGVGHGVEAGEEDLPFRFVREVGGWDGG